MFERGREFERGLRPLSLRTPLTGTKTSLGTIKQAFKKGASGERKSLSISLNEREDDPHPIDLTRTFCSLSHKGRGLLSQILLNSERSLRGASAPLFFFLPLPFGKGKGNKGIG